MLFTLEEVISTNCKKMINTIYIDNIEYMECWGYVLINGKWILAEAIQVD